MRQLSFNAQRQPVFEVEITEIGALQSLVLPAIDTSSSAFSLKYHVSAEDHSHFAVEQMRRSPQYRVLFALSVVALIGGIAVGVAGQRYGFFVGAVGVAFLVFSYQVPQRAIQRASRRPGAIGDAMLWVLDDGLLVESQFGVGLHKWEGISGVSELKSLLMIGRGGRPVIVVPKRAFAGAEDRDQFESLIRERARYRDDSIQGSTNL